MTPTPGRLPPRQLPTEHDAKCAPEPCTEYVPELKLGLEMANL